MAALLSACGKEPQRAGADTPRDEPVKQAEVEKTRTATEASNAVTSQLLGMKFMASNEAPFACDTLTAEDVEGVIGAETEVFDITEKRKVIRVAVESACLYAYGEDKNPDSIGLRAKFIMVDVYTDEAIRAAGWGTLHDQWWRRSEENSKRFDLMEDVWTAWVDSDHPPDPALLVRQGDVMIEIAYFPPSSSVGTREGNAKIESLARILVEKQKAE